MKTQWWVSVFGALCIVACSSGGPEASSDLGEEGEALSRTTVPNVASIALTRHGRPPNPPAEVGVVEDDVPVHKVLGAIKKLSGTSRGPRCATPQNYYAFHFRDAQGEEVASVVMECGSYGLLWQNDKSVAVHVNAAAFSTFAVAGPTP